MNYLQYINSITTHHQQYVTYDTLLAISCLRLMNIVRTCFNFLYQLRNLKDFHLFRQELALSKERRSPVLFLLLRLQGKQRVLQICKKFVHR